MLPGIFLVVLLAGSAYGADAVVSPQLSDECPDNNSGVQRNIYTSQVPATSLKLYLKGVVATDDNRQGYAIIRSTDQNEWHFRVGDCIYGLARLEEIYVDRIVLLRDTRYESLHLPAEFMARDHAREKARKLKAKRIVSDFRNKLVNRRGMELIKMFGFDTTYRNGGFVGFTVRIVGEEGARLLDMLDIEEGDLITAVNGKRFSESIEAAQSLTGLKDATGVDVEIDRKGTPMFFHFDFEELDKTDGTEDAT